MLLKALDDDLLAGVGCEQPVDRQITGLIDALHYRADMGLAGRLRYYVGRRDDGQSEKAVQALHTLACACRAPVEIRLDQDATRPEPANFTGVGEDWHRLMVERDRLMESPPAPVAELFDRINQPSFSWFRGLTATKYSGRLDGLEVCSVDNDGSGDIKVAGSATSPHRIAAEKVLGHQLPWSFTVDEHALAAAKISALAAAMECGELKRKPEHALEAMLLRGALEFVDDEGVVVRGPLRSFVPGGQVPVKYWPGDGSRRYTDLLVRGDTSMWVVELKAVGPTGQGTHFRHAVSQAVLYRRYLRTASGLSPYFTRQGLEPSTTKAAVAVPASAARTAVAKLRRVAALFDVEVWRLASTEAGRGRTHASIPVEVATSEGDQRPGPLESFDVGSADPQPTEQPVMTEDDIERVRLAAAAYFHLAGELAELSVLAVHASLLSADDGNEDESDPEDVPDHELFAERAKMYADKSGLAARSGAALLAHSMSWFEDLDDADADIGDVLRHYAERAAGAADRHLDVAAALEGASFSKLSLYPEMLAQQRASAQFLSAEAALFRAIADDDLDDDELDEEPDGDEAPDGDGQRSAVASGEPIGRAEAESRTAVFDRRVPDDLLDAIAPGGALGWVSALARRPVAADAPPLDLGLRALPGQTDAGRATLYLGTTKVLDVHIRHGLFRLTGHVQGGLFGDVHPPFEDRWGVWQPLSALAEETIDIGRHVEAAVQAAPAGRQVEGLYQAALTKHGAGDFVVVDREVSLSLPGGVKRRWIEEVRRPLVAAQEVLRAQHGWAKNVKAPGDKLDVLAIDGGGRVLAIEVKPGARTSGLTWTPIQVAMYVRLLRSWVEGDEAHAAVVLEEMARQRLALALNDRPAAKVRLPIEIVPVIAVGRPMTRRHEALNRFETVRAALRQAGEPLDGLQIWCVEQSGELSFTDGTMLGDCR